MESKENQAIRLGKIINIVGLKGEVRVYPYTDFKEKFEEVPQLTIGENTYLIERIRYVKNMAVIKLAGVDSQEEAEGLKDKEIFVLRKDAPPLPEDTFYVKDLLGLKVIKEGDLEVGTIKEVVIGPGQDIYMVETLDKMKSFPIPAVSEFIKEVNIDQGYILVKLIEGLEEL